MVVIDCTPPSQSAIAFVCFLICLFAVVVVVFVIADIFLVVATWWPFVAILFRLKQEGKKAFSK